MEQGALEKFLDNARGRFDKYVREIVEGEKEALPKVMFKVTVDGKVKTESSIEKFKEHAEAFYYFLPMRRGSDGVSSKKILQGGSGLLYANADALVKLEYTTITFKGFIFELQIVETQNVNDVASERKIFTLKDCEIIAHPEKLGESTMLVAFEYNKFETKNTKADPETGNAGGAKDVVEYDFAKGSAG